MIRLCANCGVKIYIGPQGWGYGYDGEYCCSYKCQREMWRQDKMLEEMKPKVDEMASEGKTPTEIAAELGLEMMKVRGYLAAKSRGKKKEATGDEETKTPSVAGATPSNAGRLVADERATNPSPGGTALRGKRDNVSQVAEASGARAPARTETETKTDLRAMVDLMRGMLLILGKMIEK